MYLGCVPLTVLAVLILNVASSTAADCDVPADCNPSQCQVAACAKGSCVLSVSPGLPCTVEGTSEEGVCDGSGTCTAEECVVLEWSAWSTCQGECGQQGTQTRNRLIFNEASACEDLDTVQRRECRMPECFQAALEVKGPNMLFHLPAEGELVIAEENKEPKTLSDLIAEATLSPSAVETMVENAVNELQSDLTEQLGEAALQLSQSIQDSSSLTLTKANEYTDAAITDLRDSLESAIDDGMAEVREDVASLSDSLSDAQPTLEKVATLESQMASLQAIVDKLQQCSLQGLAFDPKADNEQGACVATNPQLTFDDDAECVEDNSGRLRIREGDTGSVVLEICSSGRWLPITPPKLGSGPERPAQSCEVIKTSGDSTGDGIYYLVINNKVVAHFCDMSDTGVSLGGSGATKEEFTKDCAVAKAHFEQTETKEYWYSTEDDFSKAKQFICDMDGDGRVVLDGSDADSAATSCKDINTFYKPSSNGYRFLSTPAGTKEMYCDFENGGWTRVVFIDAARTCNSEIAKGQFETVTSFNRIGSPVNVCARSNFGCSRQRLNIFGIPYAKVRGQMIGIQYHSMDGFRSNDINGVPVDGAYITRLTPTSGRQHVWGFANGISKTGNHPQYNCPCARYPGPAVPSFMQNYWFCESGNPSSSWTSVWYTDDPLWDGQGCDSGSSCCGRGTWFTRDFGSSAYMPFEVNLCSDQDTGNENVGIRMLQIYVQ